MVLASRAVGPFVGLLLTLIVAGWSTDEPDAAPSSSSGRPIELRHNDWRPGEDADSALAYGALEVDGGCVIVTYNDIPREVLWPEGWTAELVDGGLEVRRGDGSVAVKAGAPLDAGGGIGAGVGCTGEAPFSINDDLR